MQARVQGFVYALLALPACRHPDGSMFDPKGFRPCDVHDVFLVGRCPVRSSNVDLANSCFTFEHFIIVIPELLCYACRPRVLNSLKISPPRRNMYKLSNYIVCRIIVVALFAFVDSLL
jgi:hypothetical protein